MMYANALLLLTLDPHRPSQFLTHNKYCVLESKDSSQKHAIISFQAFSSLNHLMRSRVFFIFSVLSFFFSPVQPFALIFILFFSAN